MDFRKLAKEMQDKNLIDDFTARMISETYGVFGLSEAKSIVELVDGPRKISIEQATRFVILGYKNPEERMIVYNAFLMFLGEEKMSHICYRSEVQD